MRTRLFLHLFHFENWNIRSSRCWTTYQRFGRKRLILAFIHCFSVTFWIFGYCIHSFGQIHLANKAINYPSIIMHLKIDAESRTNIEWEKRFSIRDKWIGRSEFRSQNLFFFVFWSILKLNGLVISWMCSLFFLIEEGRWSETHAKDETCKNNTKRNRRTMKLTKRMKTIEYRVEHTPKNSYCCCCH